MLDRVSGGTNQALEAITSSCKADLGVLGLSSLRLKYVVDDLPEVIGVSGLSGVGILKVLDAFLEIGAL